MKPGYLTTEFWVTLVMSVLTILAMSGIIAPSDKATLEGQVTNGIAAIATVITTGVAVWKYIQSRIEEKRPLAEAQAAMTLQHHEKMWQRGTVPPPAPPPPPA